MDSEAGEKIEKEKKKSKEKKKKEGRRRILHIKIMQNLSTYLTLVFLLCWGMLMGLIVSCQNKRRSGEILREKFWERGRRIDGQ